jgi:ribosomal protein S18 acetylase RimI-like enzyme
VHSCTLDSPQALGFYRRAGFVPYAREVEIFADPRIAGVLPRDAAPHVPLLE